MLIARSCNSDLELFDKIEQSKEFRDDPEVHKMPVVVFWGKDDPGIQEYSWNAVQYFSNHGFKDFQHKKFAGGHLRRPDVAYKYWEPRLPHAGPKP